MLKLKQVLYCSVPRPSSESASDPTLRSRTHSDQEREPWLQPHNPAFSVDPNDPGAQTQSEVVQVVDPAEDTEDSSGDSDSKTPEEEEAKEQQGEEKQEGGQNTETTAEGADVSSSDSATNTSPSVDATDTEEEIQPTTGDESVDSPATASEPSVSDQDQEEEPQVELMLTDTLNPLVDKIFRLSLGPLWSAWEASLDRDLRVIFNFLTLSFLLPFSLVTSICLVWVVYSV